MSGSTRVRFRSLPYICNKWAVCQRNQILRLLIYFVSRQFFEKENLGQMIRKRMVAIRPFPYPQVFNLARSKFYMKFGFLKFNKCRLVKVGVRFFLDIDFCMLFLFHLPSGAERQKNTIL